MLNYETNEVMALEIAEFLKSFDIYHDTNIFYNGKLMTIDSETQELIIEDDINVKDYVDHGNPEMITLQYQGDKSLYAIVNGGARDIESLKKYNKIVSSLIKLSEKYNRWYELGSDTCLYFVSDDEDVFITIDKYDFNEE